MVLRLLTFLLKVAIAIYNKNKRFKKLPSKLKLNFGLLFIATPFNEDIFRDAPVY